MLNSSGASPDATKKVAAQVARATCSGASHSSVCVYYSLNHGTHTQHHFRIKIRTHELLIKTAGAYSLRIYNNLSQIQHETKAFLLIVRHTLKDQYLTEVQRYLS